MCAAANHSRFPHNSQWIVSFSENIRLLTQVNAFLLPRLAVEAFEELKQDITESVITTIDLSVPLEVVNVASACAVVASLRQAGAPVAFF